MVVHSGQMKAPEFLADIVESVAATMFPGTTTHETSPLEPHQNHDRSARPKVARSDSAIYHDGGHWLRMLKLLERGNKQGYSGTATVLVTHGEPLWNEKILFTGCIDVSLTTKGVEEAVKVGDRISNIPVGMIYTSAVIRAQMSGMLAMTQEHCSKRFMFNPLLSGVVGAGLAWCRSTTNNRVPCGHDDVKGFNTRLFWSTQVGKGEIRVEEETGEGEATCRW
ncbi:2,3-bisphosphoglycerate-dependent phosphoglycerate mutase [Tanacetum coccineum]